MNWQLEMGRWYSFSSTEFPSSNKPYCILLFPVSGLRLYNIQISLSSYYYLFPCTVNECSVSKYEGKNLCLLEQLEFLHRHQNELSGSGRYVQITHVACWDITLTSETAIIAVTVVQKGTLSVIWHPCRVKREGPWTPGNECLTQSVKASHSHLLGS